VFLYSFDDNPKVKRVSAAEGVLRQGGQRGWKIRQASAFVLLADRNRQGCALNFPNRYEPRLGEGHWGH